MSSWLVVKQITPMPEGFVVRLKEEGRQKRQWDLFVDARTLANPRLLREQVKAKTHGTLSIPPDDTWPGYCRFRWGILLEEGGGQR
jgi:hypothetical protein